MNGKVLFYVSLVLVFVTFTSIAAQSAGGDVLWEKTFNFAPTYPSSIYGSLAVSSTLCIVYGDARYYPLEPPYNMLTMGYIKVYDMTTGDLKWERTINSDQYNSCSVILDGNIVYISCSSSHPVGQSSEGTGTMGAYNANTGQTIWENTATTSYGAITMYKQDPVVLNKIFSLTSVKIDGIYNVVLKVCQAQNIASPAINSLLLEK
jgi:outer membrane protein assembly factor BamB